MFQSRTRLPTPIPKKETQGVNQRYFNFPSFTEGKLITIINATN